MRAIDLAAVSGMLLVTACSAGKAETGAQTTRDYRVGNFTGLEVAGPFDVLVSTGKEPSVRVEGPQRIVEAMRVEVRNGKLHIGARRQGWARGMKWNGEAAKVTVTVPNLTAVSLAGSGDTVIDKVSGDRFAGAIAGSGNLELDRVAVQQIALSIAGSGQVKAAGQTRRASYEIAGSGNLDASALSAHDAEAEIAGSGSIRARVTGSAKASIAGSGDIDIGGGARCQQSRHGSGRIRCS